MHVFRSYCTSIDVRAIAFILVACLPLASCSDCGGDEPAQEDVAAEPDTPSVEASAAVDDAGVDAGHDAGPARPPARLFARRFVAKVRERPDREAFRIGALRAGAIVMATTAEPVRTDDRRCRRGWYELETGGFVCNGRDVIAFWGQRLPEVRGAQPDRSARLPYAYARNRSNSTPMFDRLPTDEEAVVYEGFRIPGQEPAVAATGSADDEATNGTSSESPASESVASSDVAVRSDAPATAEATASPTTTPADTPAPSAPAVPTPVTPPPSAVEATAQPSSNNASARTALSPIEGSDPAQATAPSVEGENDEETPPPPTLDSLRGEADTVLRRRLVRGFIVSLDREFRAGPHNRHYWRTINNGFVPFRAMVPIRARDFQGVELVADDTEGAQLPIGYLMSSRSRRYTLTERGRARRADAPGYHHRFPIRGEQTIGRRDYWLSDDTDIYRQRDGIRIDARERPRGIGPQEKWIEVNLTEQYLVAYEGDRPVYATLISSGRTRNPDDPAQTHPTPTGLFRIRAKHLTATMDGDNASDGPYSIDDVPYVMYFQLAYALHSAFWHNGFGRPRSHGCVNLSPLDARWVFDWSDPPLPQGWHSAYPTEETPGTWIYIHGEARQG